MTDDFERGIPKPACDKELGESYAGKYILIGITYLDHKGNETQRQQMQGA